MMRMRVWTIFGIVLFVAALATMLTLLILDASGKNRKLTHLLRFSDSNITECIIKSLYTEQAGNEVKPSEVAAVHSTKLVGARAIEFATRFASVFKSHTIRIQSGIRLSATEQHEIQFKSPANNWMFRILNPYDYGSVDYELHGTNQVGTLYINTVGVRKIETMIREFSTGHRKKE